MARLGTSGAEIEAGTTGTTPDFRNQAGTTTRDTTTFRSGVASCKCASTAAAAAYVQWPLRATSSAVAAVSGSTYYWRLYINIDALPTSTIKIASAAASGTGIGVRLTSTGTLQLFDNSGAFTQIGSDSAPLSLGTWYRIEFAYEASAGATGLRELRLDGVTVASDNSGSFAASPNDISLLTGWQTAPGATANMYIDDIALNDSTGAAQNTWPGNGKVVLLKPISLNANGGSWTDDAGATTSAALTNAVDNTPPKGIADTTAGGGDHQVRNAAANTSLDMNLATYTSAGIAAADTVNVLQPIISTGAPVVTAAKTGSYGILSNPTIANIAFVNPVATDFWANATAGTYPTGWKWERGTITHNPAVTLGTSPVARVTITGGTTTRIAMVDFIGMYVDYTPGATATPPKPTVVSQAVNRASIW